MSLQRMTLGAVLIVASMTLACSDAEGSKITERNADQGDVATANRYGRGHDDHGGHGTKEDDKLRWGPAPPIFPAGAQFALVQGDPSVAGQIFTVRLRFPNGYILPPHTHPTDEHVTVLHGTFLVGLGPDFKRSALVPLGEDGFITAPANMAHFASARGMTEVQVHAIGPFQLTYVHPSDDPTK
jgi:quercetin dioxygenase-like cupin family protein